MEQVHPLEGNREQTFDRDEVRGHLDDYPPYPRPQGSPYLAPIRLWVISVTDFLANPENLRRTAFVCGGGVVVGLCLIAKGFGQPPPASASEMNLERLTSYRSLDLTPFTFRVRVVQEQRAESLTGLITEPAPAGRATMAVGPDVPSVTVVGSVKQQYVPRHALADVLKPVFDLVSSLHL